MSSTLYVRLDGFCATSAMGRRPEAAGRPLVVFDRDLVLDSSPEACALGALPGRSLSEAKCLLGGGGVCVRFVAQEYDADRSKWLDLCVEVSHAVEPLLVSSATLDLTRHPDPRGVAEDLLVRLARFAPARLWAGLGLGVWQAEIAAKPVDVRALCLGVSVLEPCANPADLLARTPVRAMTPLPPEVVDRIGRLGYKQVGQLADSPYRVLQAQFGQSASKVQALARGLYRPLPSPLYPPDSLEVRVTFDGVVTDRLVLGQAMERLARECSRALESSGKVAEGAFLVLEQDEGNPVSTSRQFSRPVGQQGPLAAALYQMVESLSREASRPTCARVVLTRLKPSPFVQKLLVAGNDRREQDRKANQMVQATQAAFGAGAIVTGSQVKVTRREEVIRTWKRATGWQ